MTPPQAPDWAEKANAISGEWYEQSEAETYVPVADLIDLSDRIEAALRQARVQGIAEAANRIAQKAESAHHVGADRAAECYEDCADDLRALAGGEKP